MEIFYENQQTIIDKQILICRSTIEISNNTRNCHQLNELVSAEIHILPIENSAHTNFQEIFDFYMSKGNN